MNVTNVTRNATIAGENGSERDIGRLVLGFTWTNFARKSGERLFVGDAFDTTHGTWLPGLTASQTLLIESPRRYAITRSPVGFANGTLRFEGPTTFEAGSPSVTFERRTVGGVPPGQNPDNDGPRPLASIPLLALGTGVVVLGVLLGTYALRRRARASADAPVESEPTVSARPDETPEAPSTASHTPVDDELLSDEERVERLLERNGGRMKQATIVAETGWSNAKVSQLLSAMDEAEQVEKLRIGRENLISLPDEGEGE